MRREIGVGHQHLIDERLFGLEAPRGAPIAVRTAQHGCGAGERAATGQRYVSRPIDIDILLYDDEVISTPELTIPHPGIAEREFVLTPLCEVLRQRPHPVLGLTMGELRDNLLRKTK